MYTHIPTLTKWMRVCYMQIKSYFITDTLLMIVPLCVLIAVEERVVGVVVGVSTFTLFIYRFNYASVSE